MFSSTRRSRRHRRSQGPEKKDQPFFSKTNDTETQSSKSSPFFQAKLTVGQPGDQYEKEADSVADKVVNQSNRAAPVQKKGIRGFIQRITLATPQEDEKLSTAEQRMDRDKHIQEKPEVMRMDAPEEEGAVQKQEEEEAAQPKLIQREAQEEEAVQKQEEEEVQTKLIQRQGEEEEAVQKQEEEEVVQTQEEEEVQTKAEGGGGVASPQLSNRIKSAAGKGKPLPKQTRAEMESSFGVDFSEVNIHTDQNSVEMNQQLGAQAFTHGKDVYFNAGKFNPENSGGKHLLAHELTHVVQQGKAVRRKNLTPSIIQRQVKGGGSSPGTGTGIDLIYIIKAPTDQFTADVTDYVKTVLQGQKFKEVNNLQDIFNDLKTQGAKTVRRIRIVAHGSVQGQIKMTKPGGNKREWVDAQAMINMAAAVKGGDIAKKVMTSKAVVEFWGCNIGDVPKTGKALSGLFNAKVKATGETFKTGFDKYYRPVDKGETPDLTSDGKQLKQVVDTADIDARGSGWINHFNGWLLKRYQELVTNGDIRRIKGKAKRITYMRGLFNRSSGTLRHILVENDSSGEQVRPGSRRKWMKLWKTFK